MRRQLCWLLTGCLLAPMLVGCGSSESPAPDAQAESASDGGRLGPARREPLPNPIVLLKTTAGPIKIEVFPGEAPVAVERFLDLVGSGFYEQTIFHDVEPGYIALVGGYTPELQPREVSYPIQNEADNGLSNVRGTVAMARRTDLAHSGANQFFINLGDNTNLDHVGPAADQFGYCVFGRVIEGLEVVDAIAARPVEPRGEFERLTVETVMIESTERLR